MLKCEYRDFKDSLVQLPGQLSHSFGTALPSCYIVSTAVCERWLSNMHTVDTALGHKFGLVTTSSPQKIFPSLLLQTSMPFNEYVAYHRQFLKITDVVFETRVLVSRRLEDKNESLGLGLGLGS